MSTRWPAEWEEQERIWLAMPHDKETWPDTFITIRKQIADIVAKASEFQPVGLMVKPEDEAAARILINKAMADVSNLQIMPIEFNDVWLRDSLPTPLYHNGDLHFVDWNFNAWGGKYDAFIDEFLAQRFADQLDVEIINAPFECEGGGLETNGSGFLLTTDVVLNENRNPDLTKPEAVTVFRDNCYQTNIGWLPYALPNDDTDGHIDTLARFINRDTVLCAVHTNTGHPTYAGLQSNKAMLEKLGLNVIDLPQPDTIKSPNWRVDTLPASYANFVLLNNAVLVPTYNQKENDDRAIGIIAEAFPDQKVVGIDCCDILLEGGALHCLTWNQFVG